MAGYIVTAESFRQECDRLNGGRGVLRSERAGRGRAGGRVCAGARALTPGARARFCLSAAGHGESGVAAERGAGAPGRARLAPGGGRAGRPARPMLEAPAGLELPATPLPRAPGAGLGRFLERLLSVSRSSRGRSFYPLVPWASLPRLGGLISFSAAGT